MIGCSAWIALGTGLMSGLQADFRLMMNQDACATEKTAEGLRAFIADTDKLEAATRRPWGFTFRGGHPREAGLKGVRRSVRRVRRCGSNRAP